MNSSNKRAVVVGGSKGLGLDTVAALARHGCRVVALARSEGGLPALRQQYPDRIQLIQTDLGDTKSVCSAFARIKSELGGIDYLVLNAASTVPSTLANLDDASIQSQLAINVAGPIACMREAAAQMQGGTMVYISSESVNYPFPMLHLYAAMKAGMETFLRGVRGELYRQAKVRVVTFRVGTMAGTAFSEGWSEAVLQEFFQVAAEAGHLGKSGTPMPTPAVAEAIVQVLSMPDSTNVDLIEFRSADAH